MIEVRRSEKAVSRMKLPLLLLGAALIANTSAPETRVRITLPRSLAENAHGRLLVFLKPVASADREADAVDVGDPSATDVAVAAAEVTAFDENGSALVDTRRDAFPNGFGRLAAGEYRVQAVLDRNGDYAYSGRGPGDLVSEVTTIRLPLVSPPSIALDHVVPPPPAQFDTTGLPPKAAEQIAASRPHLHDERIGSAALSRFSHSPQAISAWVLTPPGYDPNGRTTYPTVYTAGGFGDDHRFAGQSLSRIWHLMETGEIPPMIWVSLDYATPAGTTEFADSANNGPWDHALIDEVIPALESRYRMDAKPSGRFLTGHSSGGWFAIWAMVKHPAFFGGSWASSPDPVDFHDFIGVDLYAPGANMYRDAAGSPRPFERDHDTVLRTTEQAAKLENVLGTVGGQIRSFDWTFSPRRADGRPARMFDPKTGAVDPAVVAHWGRNYDIAHIVETEWPKLGRDLDGKVHVAVGTADSFHLDGAVRGLDAAFRKVGGRAEFIYVPGATHSMAQVYARDGDRNAFYKDMAKAMYAIARPSAAAPK
jgi:hypothetical protein